MIMIIALREIETQVRFVLGKTGNIRTTITVECFFFVLHETLMIIALRAALRGSRRCSG